MAEGLGQERWGHTSALMALIANANRDPRKSKTFKPDDFNPYARDRCANDQEVIEVTKQNIGLLRQAFTGRKGKSL